MSLFFNMDKMFPFLQKNTFIEYFNYYANFELWDFLFICHINKQ